MSSAKDGLLSSNRLNLLTLPRSDLLQQQPHSNTNDALVLLQLPPHWTPDDVAGAVFMGSSDDSQVALVVESKRQSFNVHRAETSNVMVVIPPPPHDDVSRHKRAKTVDGKPLVPVSSRLVKKGGNGASFLELRAKELDLDTLKSLLETYDPYACDPKLPQGRTIHSLALQLKVTDFQVQQGLQAIQAFPIPNMERSYCLLSTEAWVECYSVILSTLAEVEPYQDYAHGVQLEAFLQDAVKRMSAQERFDYARDVIRLGLNTLASTEQVDGATTLRLDVTKVAGCVARRLFLKQSEPWEETLLLVRWQAELPGVGEQYVIHVDMLKDIAESFAVDDDHFWRLRSGCSSPGPIPL